MREPRGDSTAWRGPSRSQRALTLLAVLLAAVLVGGPLFSPAAAQAPRPSEPPAAASSPAPDDPPVLDDAAPAASPPGVAPGQSEPSPTPSSLDGAASPAVLAAT